MNAFYLAVMLLFIFVAAVASMMIGYAMVSHILIGFVGLVFAVILNNAFNYRDDDDDDDDDYRTRLYGAC